MKYIFVLLLALSAVSLHAEFAVIAVTGSSLGNCTGSVTLRLNGDAGPFGILIPETGFTLTDVEGDVVVNNLCTGNYTIMVSVSQFPGCSKSLSLFIPKLSDNLSGITPTPRVVEDAEAKTVVGLTDVQKNIKVYPNPGRGMINLEFKNMHQYPIELLIFSDQGQKVLLQNLPAGTYQFSANLTRLPSGLYFVIARQEDGTFVQQSLVIKS